MGGRDRSSGNQAGGQAGAASQSAAHASEKDVPAGWLKGEAASCSGSRASARAAQRLGQPGRSITRPGTISSCSTWAASSVDWLSSLIRPELGWRVCPSLPSVRSFRRYPTRTSTRVRGRVASPAEVAMSSRSRLHSGRALEFFRAGLYPTCLSD